MAGRRRRGEAHVRLYRHELDSEAYRSLSTDARALLVEMRALYSGGAENRVYISVRQIMERLGGIGQRRAQRARDELLDRGFVRMLKPGGFSCKVRHASEYALCDVPLDPTKPGATPPKDFMRYRRQKSTVADSATNGSRSSYRGASRACPESSHGSHNDYREPQSGQHHASRSDYTDRLPPQGDKGDGDGAAWRCRNGSLLNACCMVCGVWITSDGHEFDGRRHSCDSVSRNAYKASAHRKARLNENRPPRIAMAPSSSGN